MPDTIDRITDPDWSEYESDSYIRAVPDPETGMKVIGLEIGLYVLYPEVIIRQGHGIHHKDHPHFGVELTEYEEQLWVEWIRDRYPHPDWQVDGDDQAEAIFYQEWVDGEGNEETIGRITKMPGYTNIRNYSQMFYRDHEDFMDYILKRREETA